MSTDPIGVVAMVVAALDRLGIRYLVGGSYASSIYGIPRATQDVDLVADLKLSDVKPFAELLTGEFYVDVEVMRDAVGQRRPFNVIHLESMFKADIFAMGEGSWPSVEMGRARLEELVGPQGPVQVRFASPSRLGPGLRCFKLSGGT